MAKYSGINTVMIKWSTFVISGVMAALAGILLSSRMNSASSVYGDNTGCLLYTSTMAGEQAAQAIIDAFPDGCNVVEIGGQSGHDAQVKRSDGFKAGLEAVSYTHLDVYKRQLVG